MKSILLLVLLTSSFCANAQVKTSTQKSKFKEATTFSITTFTTEQSEKSGLGGGGYYFRLNKDDVNLIFKCYSTETQSNGKLGEAVININKSIQKLNQSVKSDFNKTVFLSYFNQDFTVDLIMDYSMQPPRTESEGYYAPTLFIVKYKNKVIFKRNIVGFWAAD